MRTILLIAAVFFAASARADVSDSGNLTIGNNGVIVGTMTVGSISLAGSTGTVVSQSSVTASAFFGDGSHLTGVQASQTFFYVLNSTDSATSWAIFVDDDGALRTTPMAFSPSSATSLPIQATNATNWTITIDDDGTLRTNP